MDSPIIITVPAGEFKAKCLALMDEVESTGKEIVITKHNRPVARLAPVHPATVIRPLFGRSRGRIRIVGDMIAPIGPDWDVGDDY